jgi:hypothetical protein
MDRFGAAQNSRCIGKEATMKNNNYIMTGVILVTMASTALAQDSSGSASGTTSGSGAAGSTSTTTPGAGAAGSTTTTTTGAGNTNMMQMTEAEKSTTSKWTGPIGEALFSDASMSRLRSQDEIRANWSKLTPEQQDQVKRDCNTMESASTSAGGGTATTGTTGSGTPDTTASTGGKPSTSAAGTAPGETTGSTAEGSVDGAAGTSTDGDTMTVAQLCGMVNSM